MASEFGMLKNGNLRVSTTPSSSVVERRAENPRVTGSIPVLGGFSKGTFEEDKMAEYKYKQGDVVKVWSLQSFHGGGFLEGVEGVVKQNQIGSSVIVAVPRKIDGKMQVDPSYEVYEQQLEFVHRPKKLPDGFQELIHRLKSM